MHDALDARLNRHRARLKDQIEVADRLSLLDDPAVNEWWDSLDASLVDGICAAKNDDERIEITIFLKATRALHLFLADIKRAGDRAKKERQNG